MEGTLTAKYSKNTSHSNVSDKQRLVPSKYLPFTTGKDFELSKERCSICLATPSPTSVGTGW